ncbi:unnamed protein product [Cyprideis torosa]|uniref:Uncharacterized protein n=1 Tax=Cyprideis torosa TaxID=163714 RepID=A0A7R8ZTM8_9CRUS|nr:unnamed protein product [Cyprideis torosa]CAG0904397.1 unnamed protein product [Cyprideis torosa]
MSERDAFRSVRNQIHYSLMSQREFVSGRANSGMLTEEEVVADVFRAFNGMESKFFRTDARKIDPRSRPRTRYVLDVGLVSSDMEDFSKTDSQVESVPENNKTSEVTSSSHDEGEQIDTSLKSSDMEEVSKTDSQVEEEGRRASENDGVTGPSLGPLIGPSLVRGLMDIATSLQRTTILHRVSIVELKTLLFISCKFRISGAPRIHPFQPVERNVLLRVDVSMSSNIASASTSIQFSVFDK